MDCPHCRKEIKFALRSRRGCSGAKRELLSKRRIRELSKLLVALGLGSVEAAALCDMAEEYRKIAKAAKKRKLKKVKTYLKPTDRLSLRQFGKIIRVVSVPAEATRQHNGHINRAVVNEMLIHLMVETGLRVSEVCDLKLRNLPSHHGQPEVEVEDGKGHKDRTVTVSQAFEERLGDYVRRYARYGSGDSWLFHSEQGGQMKRWSVYSRVKRIGVKAGIWLYRKNGVLKSKITPHKFRHTHGTFLLDVTDNEFLVQDQLGHKNSETTHIYAKALAEKKRKAMNDFHNRLFGATGRDFEGE